ncbi:MAG: putative polysaccharide deacetylase [Verrucomicrobiaceae bacterium]|nr:putative polysaccharide deacetylase [Verrucomicrobiaceae bacterium]
MKPTPLLTLIIAACLPLAASAEDAPAASTSTTPAPKLSYKEFHINTNAVAMTFDDGPHPANTPRLLDILKERGIKATFFLIGRSVATHPEIVRRIVAEGHEVANHTWDHKMLRSMGPEKINEELQKTHDAILEACGIAPTVYRPPFGAINTKQQKLVMEKFHYPSIVWEIDTDDWRAPRSIAKVHDAILKDAHAGSIILCHDIHSETVDAMPTTLDDLKAKGFLFMTVSQLIKLEADEVKAVAAGKGLPAASTTTPTTPATPAAPKTEAKPEAKTEKKP